MPEDSEKRQELLTAVGEWILANSEPTPRMLMTLAKIQRSSLPDPAAGFEAATTASLTALADESIQEEYASWLGDLAPATVHSQRGKLATYLCTQESRLDLLEVALDELEALAEVNLDELPAEPLEWLRKLRPQLDNVSA